MSGAAARKGNYVCCINPPCEFCGVHMAMCDCGKELVTVGKMPVGGVGHHAYHPGRFPQHDGVRATGPGQLEPCGDQAVADGAARPAPPHHGYLTCRPV